MATTRITPKRQEVLEMLRKGCTLIVHAKLGRQGGIGGGTLVWSESGKAIDTVLISGGQVAASAGDEPVVTRSRSIRSSIVRGLQEANLIVPVRNFNKGHDWVYTLADAGPVAIVPRVLRPQWGG